MKIAVCQISSSSDPKENLLLVERYTKQAQISGASLVIFPEATMCCFGTDLSSIAEPIDGPWATSVRDIARLYDVTIAAGMFTPGDSGRVENTMLIVGPTTDTTYRKIHLYDAFGFAESDTVAPGDALVTADIEGRRIGFTTCYDVRFPELFKALAARGAEAIVAAASWGAGPGKADQWTTLVRARALDSATFVLACDQASPQEQTVSTAPMGVGHSLVANPYGEVMSQLEEEPGLLIVELDFEVVAEARIATGVLANQRLVRPEVYLPI